MLQEQISPRRGSGASIASVSQMKLALSPTHQPEVVLIEPALHFMCFASGDSCVCAMHEMREVLQDLTGAACLGKQIRKRHSPVQAAQMRVHVLRFGTRSQCVLKACAFSAYHWRALVKPMEIQHEGHLDMARHGSQSLVCKRPFAELKVSTDAPTGMQDTTLHGCDSVRDLWQSLTLAGFSLPLGCVGEISRSPSELSPRRRAQTDSLASPRSRVVAKLPYSMCKTFRQHRSGVEVFRGLFEGLGTFIATHEWFQAVLWVPFMTRDTVPKSKRLRNI